MIIACTQCGARNRVEAEVKGDRIAKCGKCGAVLVSNTEMNAAANGRPVNVTDATFESVVLGTSGRPILVDCWAAWCGPCRMIAPVLDELAAEARGRYTIAKLNVDENPVTAARFQVRSIPTLLVFKNGELVDRIVGAQPKEAIAGHLQRAA